MNVPVEFKGLLMFLSNFQNFIKINHKTGTATKKLRLGNGDFMVDLEEVDLYKTLTSPLTGCVTTGQMPIPLLILVLSSRNT